MKQKLKQTEIGMIPEDWDIQKIGDLFEIKVGGDLHKLQYSDTKDDKFKFPIYSNSIERDGVLGYATNYQYQDGCITITARGTLGYAFPRYDQFNAVVRLLILIPKKKVELVFVAHYINNNINFNLEKTSIPQLTAPKIARYLIPFPPLPEQKSISEVLSTVDARLDIVERESQRVERLKVGLMKELFDGKKWKLQKITDIFEIETGTTPSTKVKEYWDNGTVNWITPADMNNLDNTLDLPESKRKITQKALKEVNLTLMPSGSIVISTRAPVGYIGLVKKELTFNQGCKGLIPKDKSKVNTIFYAYYLLSLQEYLNNISGGSTFKELSKDSLCKLEMPVPSISEQNEIANILLTVDKKLSIQQSKKSKLESIKKSLMNDLLTGKKRVKL